MEHYAAVAAQNLQIPFRLHQELQGTYSLFLANELINYLSKLGIRSEIYIDIYFYNISHQSTLDLVISSLLVHRVKIS